MKPVFTASEIRRVDELTTARFGVPSLTLMENAGAAVAQTCLKKIAGTRSNKFLVLCGKGNNGGDGFVAARYLSASGAEVEVVTCGTPDQFSPDARTQFEKLTAAGVQPIPITSEDQWKQFVEANREYSLVIDALLGTGLTRTTEGVFRTIIETTNAAWPEAAICAVDIPSGLDADSHHLIGPTIRADFTVTITAPKIALAFPPACEQAGEIFIAPIGSPDSLLHEVAQQNIYFLEKADLKFLATPRPVNAHKGAYGHALIVAGSVGKSGAAILAGMAALRVGAGLVTVAVPRSVQPIVAQGLPELMTVPLPETKNGSIDLAVFDYGMFDELVIDKNVLAIGPGLTTQTSTSDFVRTALTKYSLPMVVDADAVNALAGRTDLLKRLNHNVVLTPHPGEFSRLINVSPRDIQKNRHDHARPFAIHHHVHLVLKGYRTIIATPDGRIFVCPTGNPGMATAGTGDVLTGILAGLIAQHASKPFEQVLCAGVLLHGLAGDLARDEMGEASVIATDLVRKLPEAFKEIAAT